MKKNDKMLLAAACAGLLLTAGCTTTKHNAMVLNQNEAKGECHGVNACKGTGDCGGKGYSCSGKNACKGKGWKEMTKKECDAKNGKFKAKKA